MTNLNQILNTLPDYAKDIKLNLTSLINTHNSLITKQQFYGCLLSTALATSNQLIIDTINNEVKEYLNHDEINGAKAAATIMAMTNVYYRFTDLIRNDSYSRLPAGLRMNIMREHKVNKTDVEAWSLAVSIINGCSMCISAHEKQLITHGFKQEQVQLIAKIAATINALAITCQNIN